eukprot:3174919-Rhodomonas_salina.1
MPHNAKTFQNTSSSLSASKTEKDGQRVVKENHYKFGFHHVGLCTRVTFPGFPGITRPFGFWFEPTKFGQGTLEQLSSAGYGYPGTRMPGYAYLYPPRDAVPRVTNLVPRYPDTLFIPPGTKDGMVVKTDNFIS